jgi:hypothetical protein
MPFGCTQDRVVSMTPRNISIWAFEYHFANPCPVATVDDALRYPAATQRGQAGWDYGVRFHDLEDLASQLEGGLVGLCKPPLRRGELVSLAI